MKVTFWGVRGSIPTSGKDTTEYGGHTSCVAVVPGDDSPPLVFDLGTGARPLGRSLLKMGVETVHVLLSHTHMDHIFALPYFEPIFSPSCRVHVGVPAGSDGEARARIGKYLNGIFHPLRLDDLGPRLRFHGVPGGKTFNVGPYRVKTLRLVHPGGTIGYRVDYGGCTACYLTDTGPLARPNEGVIVGEEPTAMESELIELVHDADLLVMDTTFDEAEYFAKMHWGHAFPEYAAKIAGLANVKKLALFHHSPDAVDSDLDALAARWERHTAPEVVVAKEGLVVDLEG